MSERLYTYTVRTDAVMTEIEAHDIDEAARIFAADEASSGDRRMRDVTGVDDLFWAVERIGDGAWAWIEGPDAPDGERRSYHSGVDDHHA